MKKKLEDCSLRMRALIQGLSEICETNWGCSTSIDRVKNHVMITYKNHEQLWKKSEEDRIDWDMPNF